MFMISDYSDRAGQVPVAQRLTFRSDVQSPLIRPLASLQAIGGFSLYSKYY